MKEKPVEYTENYKRTIFTWSMYDFANQPYPTIIITFIYSAFFTGVLASGDPYADSKWLIAISVCAVIIALLSPLLGVIADRSGYRKTYLMVSTWICIITALFIYIPLPGQIFLPLLLVIVSNAAFEMGQVFCNSYLPDIAPREKIGRISGYGWSLGYFGGLVALFAYFIFFMGNSQTPFDLNKLSNIEGEEVSLNKEFSISGNVDEDDCKCYSKSDLKNKNEPVNARWFEEVSRFDLEAMKINGHNIIKWKEQFFEIRNPKMDKNNEVIGIRYLNDSNCTGIFWLFDINGEEFEDLNDNGSYDDGESFLDCDPATGLCEDDQGWEPDTMGNSEWDSGIESSVDIDAIDISLKSTQNIRFVSIFVALWFALFSVPTFIFLKDHKKKKLGKGAIRKSYYQVYQTFKEVKKYKNIARFLLARMLYNDAVLTIFGFGGIYAVEKFKWSTFDVFEFGIWLNVAAGSGAFLFGFLDDKLGAKRTIQMSNYAIFFAVMLAILSPSEGWFFLAGIIMGVASGPNQSASRSLMGRIVPKGKTNEFYGFYAFSGKATSFAGFLLLAIMIAITGSQEIGMLAVSLLLIGGIYFLSNVKDELESD